MRTRRCQGRAVVPFLLFRMHWSFAVHHCSLLYYYMTVYHCASTSTYTDTTAHASAQFHVYISVHSSISTSLLTLLHYHRKHWCTSTAMCSATLQHVCVLLLIFLYGIYYKDIHVLGLLYTTMCYTRIFVWNSLSSLDSVFKTIKRHPCAVLWTALPVLYCALQQ